MSKIIIAYVPVLHEGYRRFFEKYNDAETLYIFGQEIIDEFDYLRKEIRALSPELIKKAVESWNIFPNIEILDKNALNKIQESKSTLIMPDEDVTKNLAQSYLPKKKIVWDTIFLRWDKHKVMEEKPVEADQKISREKFDREVISKLKIEAEKSSDWWRRIGSVVVKEGEIILLAHNEHLPSPHSPYAFGDPRNTLHKGVGIEYSSSIHSEARIVAEAARKGISLSGLSLYASTFPCPPCAKQIAFSGIKKLYYSGGYSILDQESILKSQGVEIIFVEM